VAKKSKRKTEFRCTFEWDRVVGHGKRNDALLRRHICTRPMHHEGKHKSSSGHTSETLTGQKGL